MTKGYHPSFLIVNEILLSIIPFLISRHAIPFISGYSFVRSCQYVEISTPLVLLSVLIVDRRMFRQTVQFAFSEHADRSHEGGFFDKFTLLPNA
jgi:hypothetical protein